jgi:hypothetical protein
MQKFHFITKVKLILFIFLLILFTTQSFALDRVSCNEYKDMGDMSREKTCFFPNMKLAQAYKKAIKEKYSTFKLEQFMECSIPKHSKNVQLGKGAEITYINYIIKNKRNSTIDMLTGIASFTMNFTEDDNGTTIKYSISAD